MPGAPVENLKRILGRIDGRSYKAYKDLRGRYRFDGFELFIDHVQGDPFAAPSKLRLRVPWAVPGPFAGHLAFEDFHARRVREAIGRHVRGRRGTGKSGLVWIDAGAQEVLDRTAEE